jgi:peptidoglycan/LPS O-acetylase OafA/YrhL
MNLFKLNPDYDKRVYGLDVFRAVAIILVVIGHGAFIVNLFAPGFPYFKFIDGVELFFVLSGFLIGTILLKQLSQEYTPSFSNLLKFWKRRWFRTLPNYYLILFVNYLLVKFSFIKGDIAQADWTFLVFAQNLYSPFVDFFWESWSLSIEEWFYILFPIVLVLVARIRAGKNFRTTSLMVILIFMTLPLIYRFSISEIEVNAFWYDVKFRKVVITRLDSIMYGVLMAWFKFYYHESFYRYRIPMFITGLALIYSVILPEKETGSLFMKTLYFSLVGLGASFLLPYADSVKKFRTGFGKVIVHISLVSYSMYLLNLAPVAQVIEQNFMPQGTTSAALTYIIYWGVVILLSTLLYKYFEKPAMDLRDK